MVIDDCAKAREVRATAMTVASASRFMAFSTATEASFYRKYYADGIPRAVPGTRGTIRSGSRAAYCVHSPLGAKRLDRLNLRSRAGEITAARPRVNRIKVWRPQGRSASTCPDAARARRRGDRIEMLLCCDCAQPVLAPLRHHEVIRLSALRGPERSCGWPSSEDRD